jgi:hypothetical protein
MVDWKDCWHCDSPSEHAMHTRIAELESKLQQYEIANDGFQKALIEKGRRLQQVSLWLNAAGDEVPPESAAALSAILVEKPMLKDGDLVEIEGVVKRLVDVEKLCSYCGAPDNGTCAYPSEGKPGCFQREPRLDEDRTR